MGQQPPVRFMEYPQWKNGIIWVIYIDDTPRILNGMHIQVEDGVSGSNQPQQRVRC